VLSEQQTKKLNQKGNYTLQ